MNKDYKELSGEIITQNSSEYENFRKQWNRAVESYPTAIIYCKDTVDVQKAVIWCRETETKFRIRSGGHHYEGFSTGNDIVVIDISRLNLIEVDESKGYVSIGGGVRNRELYEAVCGLGYPFPGGGCPTVGAAAFTLGGGWGYSSRYLGLGCDSLIEAEIVNYNGEILTANETINSDLFWALRGCGGGNLGVVVKMTFSLPQKIHEATLINVDYKTRDENSIVNIVGIYEEMFENLDLRANFKMSIYNSKEDGTGVKFTGVFYGGKEEALEIIKPLIIVEDRIDIYLNTTEVFRVNEIIQDSHPEYEKYKSFGRFIRSKLTGDQIRSLVQAAKTKPQEAYYTAFTFYGLGGKVKEKNKYDTAFYYRDARFILGCQVVWEDNRNKSLCSKWLLSHYDTIKGITEGAFVNFPLGDMKDYGYEYYGSNYERLIEIKQKYDPVNLFDFEQGI